MMSLRLCALDAFGSSAFPFFDRVEDRNWFPLHLI